MWKDIQFPHTNEATPLSNPTETSSWALLIAGYVFLLPYFSGDGVRLSVQEFFQTFEDVVSIAGWNDAEKIMIAK